MSIGSVCYRTRKASTALHEYRNDISKYCTQYARKLTGNPKFEFESLPDPIIKALFDWNTGSSVDVDSWPAFLKEAVRDELNAIGLRV